MKPKVYLETTIPSYLAAQPSRDLVTAARQQLTREWWERRASDFALYVSEIVVEEARARDKQAAARRLQFLDGLPLLDVTEEAEALASRLMKEVPLPPAAAVDALHIAVAAASGMEWNSTHIANAELRAAIERICESADLVLDLTEIREGFSSVIRHRASGRL